MLTNCFSYVRSDIAIMSFLTQKDASTIDLEEAETLELSNAIP
jgi:hypothetical protein